MIPPELIEKLRKLERGATKSPWEFERVAHDSGEFSYERNYQGGLIAIREMNFDKPMQAKFDAELIQESRNALLPLLDALEVATGALEFYGYEAIHNPEAKSKAEQFWNDAGIWDHGEKARAALAKIREDRWVRK